MSKFFRIRYGWVMLLAVCMESVNAQSDNAGFALHFSVMANGKNIVLGDSSYTNAHGESYQLTRVKFYISNISFDHKKINSEVYLVDASRQDSIAVPAPAGEYSTLRFTVGVDSALNCSGAQTGALDPLNGMFWTWNSGYIFFKMEGYSPSSTADLNRIEHHIGGYRSPYNTAREIVLTLPGKVLLNANSQKQIFIGLDLDQYWQGEKDAIKITDKALLMIPGEFAVKAANQLSRVFLINAVK